MHIIDQAIIEQALTNTEHAILQVGGVEEGPERPHTASESEAIDHALSELEAARASLRRALRLSPASHLPVGRSSACADAPASAGSRRTGKG